MNPENQITNPCPNPETPEHLFNDAGAPGRLHFSFKNNDAEKQSVRSRLKVRQSIFKPICNGTK